MVQGPIVTNTERLLIYLKKLALAGQIEDYRTIYKKILRILYPVL